MKEIRTVVLPLAVGRAVGIPLPSNADILGIQRVGRKTCVCVLADWSLDCVARCFEWFGAGDEIDGKERRFVGAVYVDGRIWYVFERVAYWKETADEKPENLH